MAKSRPSIQKRNNEAKKIEKNQDKAERRAARRAERGQGREEVDGIDPDLVGIRPGPQPVEDDPLSVL